MCNELRWMNFSDSSEMNGSVQRCYVSVINNETSSVAYRWITILFQDLKKKERTTTLSGILSFSSAFLTHVLCLWTGCRSWRPTRRFICSEFHTLQHHLICTRTEAKLLWKQVRGGHGFTNKSEMSFIWTVNSVKRHRYELLKGNSAPFFKNGAFYAY